MRATISSVKHRKNMMQHCFLLFIGLVLLQSVAASAQKQPGTAPGNGKPAVAVIPTDGFNLEITDCLPFERPQNLPASRYRIATKLTHPVHNFFAGRFINLPTDKEVTIGLSMVGNDTKGNNAYVGKWVGLRPVFSYADPTKYESYEWFAKDEQGRWVSGDIFKKGQAKYAGTGKVPEQQVIPANIAVKFLSTDGKYWSPWGEIENVEVMADVNAIRIKQKFDLPTATVSMVAPH
jgi:hypothetical protein